MPIYEYSCDSCEHAWETQQSIKEEPIRTCPKCGKQEAKRLISRTGFCLVGGGWGRDLYGSTKPV